jgi:DNA-binding CsgD family transcriptional regulator
MCSSATSTRNDDQLRIIALRLVDAGLSSKKIAAILDIKTMTVAAWKAHRTMGKYR